MGKRKKKMRHSGDAQTEADAGAPENRKLECLLCDFTADSQESLKKSRKMLRRHVKYDHAAEVEYDMMNFVLIWDIVILRLVFDPYFLPEAIAYRSLT